MGGSGHRGANTSSERPPAQPAHEADRWRDVQWLRRVLGDAGGDDGPRRITDVEVIGIGFGLSGVVRRLHVELASGGRHSVVAKVEAAGKVRRALLAHQHVEPVMGAAMPVCLGGDVGPRTGVLLLSDIRPATQGDELRSCPPDRAAGLVGAVAKLHAGTDGGPPVLPRHGGHDVPAWEAPPASPDAWGPRLDVAATTP